MRVLRVSPGCNISPGKLDRRQEQVEQSIQRYLDLLEMADRTQPVEAEAKTERRQEKIAKLRNQMRKLDEMREQLKSVPGRQVSTTDPDARSMATKDRRNSVLKARFSEFRDWARTQMEYTADPDLRYRRDVDIDTKWHSDVALLQMQKAFEVVDFKGFSETGGASRIRTADLWIMIPSL